MRAWKRVLSPLAVIIAFLLLPDICPAQSVEAWPSLPKEDLQLKDNPANPGDAAMILERRVFTDDDKRYETNFIRIKIFKKEGTKYANINIVYQAKKYTIEEIRGRTIQSDGTITEFNGAVFDDVLAKYRRVNYQLKSFTLPGAEPGAIIEYSYKLRWKKPIPNYVQNPAMYTFDGCWAFPTASWTINQDLFTRHAVFVLRPIKNIDVQWATLRFHQSSPVMQADKTIKMEVSNVPSLLDEDAMPPPSFVDSSVQFYYIHGYISNYWLDYGRRSGEQLDRYISVTSYIKKTVVEAAPPSDPPEVRIRKLYAKVQQLRNLSYEHGRTKKERKNERLADNKNVEDVLRHGYGYSDELRFLFVAFARAAGFSSDLVLVADRSERVFTAGIPDADQLDLFLVQVRINGKLLFLDPGTPFCPFGMLQWYASGTRGVVLNAYGGTETRTPPQGSEDSVLQRNATFKLTPDGGVRGRIEISFRGVQALEWRLLGTTEDEDGRQKMIEDGIKEMLPPQSSLKNVKVSGWEESEQPFEIKCDVEIPTFAFVSTRRMLFPSVVFSLNRKSLVSPRGRTHPVYYNHGYRVIDNLEYTVPEGYRVEVLPERLRIEKEFFKYRIEWSSDGHEVRIARQNELNGYYFSPELYRELWVAWVTARSRDDDSVVLQKISQ